MKFDVNQTDELWDLERPKIPPRSSLFHLEPIGIGTPYVESITSYVARLAEAHSVAVGTLIAAEIQKKFSKSDDIQQYYYPSLVKVYGQYYIKSLNGTSVKAKQFVAALNQLTLRDDLEFLTLLTWAEVLPSQELLSPDFAWCPQCYQEWRDSSKVIYSPLLWSLQSVNICLEHHRPLQSICPQCHQKFVPLWQTTRPGYCLKCDAWLGGHYPSVLHHCPDMAQSLEWEIWFASALGELLSKAVLFNSIPPRDSINKAIKLYANQLTNGNISALGRFLGVNRYKFLHWHQGSTIPIISELLKICYTLSTSLVDFLQAKVNPVTLDKLAILASKTSQRRRKYSVTYSSKKDIEATRAAMQQALFEEPPPTLTQLAYRFGYKSYSPLTHISKSLATAIKARATDYATLKRQQHIRELLQGVIDNNLSPPPSLSEVARCHHIGLATFYLYCPDLCQIIVERYKHYHLLRRLEVIQQGCLEVQQIVPQLYAQGINPTLKNIRQFMAKPSALWKKEVVDAFWEARRSVENA